MSRRSTGRPRGRPPHPEPLTPAEQRVLELVRAGKSNPEIAFELDLSLGTVKTHVSNMLSKLGHADRHELAAWQPGGERAVGRWWGLTALPGRVARRAIDGARRLLGSRARFVASGLAAGVLALGAILLAVLARPGRPDPAATPVAVATTPAGPAVTPSTQVVTPTPQPPVSDPWAELRQRALALPALAPGDPCPVTPGRPVAADLGSTGPGPVYFSGSEVLQPLRKRPDWFSMTPRWWIDGGYSGPVLVRGGRIDGAGQLRFLGSGAALAHDAAACPARPPPMVVAAAGCYALQVDTTVRSSIIVFTATLAGPDDRQVHPSVAFVRPDGGDISFTLSGFGYPGWYFTRRSGTPPAVRFAGGIDPVWSPDGRWVASAGCFDDACGNVVQIHDSDGREVRSFQPAAPTCIPHGVRSPSWSPDSRIIAYEVRECDRNGDANIYTFTIDQTDDTLVALTNRGRPNWAPAWSPDGRRAAFVSERDGNPEVYVMDADGTHHRRLTANPGFDGYPQWSPDGRLILFESIRAARRGIWVMNADGSQQREVAPGPGSDWYPAWSPDGSRIAFSSDRESGRFHIYVVNADGTGLARATGGPGNDWSPRWSPEGDVIAFLTNRDGHAELYTARPDGSDVTRVTTTSDGDVTYFTWAPTTTD